ncbi:MAG: type IV pilus modification protein PilV [Pseudomonadota bacterium]
MTTIKHQLGFNLVEVLIALIIMSIGMLGIAGLYVNSLQAGRTSMFRTQAVLLAGDVADRIRANPSAGAAYTEAGSNKNCVSATADCSAADMAANDVFLWTAQASESLPAGTVGIVRNDTPFPAEYTITISWEEPGATQNYTVTIPVAGS